VIGAFPLRRLSALIAPGIFAAMLLLNARHSPTYVMGDFRAFYCAGQAIAHGANPYLNEPLRTCEANAGPPEEPAFLEPVALPAPLPPYALLLFVPFALLPFPVAAVCWGAVLVGAMALAVALLRRVTGVSSVVLDLVFAPIAATVTFYVGQPVPLVFAALAGAALFVRRERWAAAAACAAFASIEPHVALAALAGMLVAFPRARIPVLLCGAVLAAVSALGVGLGTVVSYVRDVVPAHALANVYEWQFSLTSVLTSLGVAAPAAIRAGELMFAAMTLLGVLAALRLKKMTGDPAVMVIVPPAFALFGGVHVHFQQLAVAFPAVLYVYARYPRVRALAASGVAFAMIPWNVMGASVLAGLSPLIAGAFGALTLSRRAGLLFAVAAAGIGVSLLVLANAGLGPTEAHFVARAYPPNALAELSWGEFSRVALARPSVMMQWLRIPTIAGLACGLIAIGWAAFGDLVRARGAALRAPAPAGATASAP
jgi:Glycosyltransferase family 87